MRLIDITGQRFGRLVVGDRAKLRSSGGSMWLCRCDCGTEKAINASNLRNGTTRSCGCLHLERASLMGSDRAYIARRAEKIVRHGQKRRGAASPEYKVWLGMKRRCSDRQYKDYPHWGGRGIRVCDRWDSSFEAFRADMGPRPSPLHTVERKDNDGDYAPGNCVWLPRWSQAANRRTTVRVETPSGTVCLAQFARMEGVPYRALHWRVKHRGDTPHAAARALRARRFTL